MAVALTLSKTFLAEALVAKTTPLYATEEKYKGVSYDKEIYPQARMQFKEYDKLYSTNEEFTKYFVRDLNSKDPKLLAAIAPKATGAEETTAVPAEQGVPEQTPVGTATGTMGMPGLPSAPFISSPRMASMTHDIPRAPSQPETPQPKIYIANKSGTVTEERSIKPPSTSRGFNFRPSATFTNTLRNFGSRAGVFFQRNVGKYFTVGRVATVASTGIGAITGAALTNGSAIGIFGGGGLGAITPSWIKSGGGGRFLGRVGNGAINAGVGISNQVSRGSLSLAGPKKRIWLGAVGLFVLMFGATLFAGLLPGETPIGQAAPFVGGVASCPVVGGTISTPSYNADPAKGHCGGGYDFSCNCGTSGRRAKAIDVPTRGQDVVLPKIENQTVSWTMVTPSYTVDSGEGGGVGYTFKATLGSDTWYLDMLHLQTSSLRSGIDYPSDTVVAKSAISHVHTTIGKNLSRSPVAGSTTDCDPNWLPSDFMCK